MAVVVFELGAPARRLRQAGLRHGNRLAAAVVAVVAGRFEALEFLGGHDDLEIRGLADDVGRQDEDQLGLLLRLLRAREEVAEEREVREERRLGLLRRALVRVEATDDQGLAVPQGDLGVGAADRLDGRERAARAGRSQGSGAAHLREDLQGDVLVADMGGSHLEADTRLDDLGAELLVVAVRKVERDDRGRLLGGDGRLDALGGDDRRLGQHLRLAVDLQRLVVQRHGTEVDGVAADEAEAQLRSLEGEARRQAGAKERRRVQVGLGPAEDGVGPGDVAVQEVVDAELEVRVVRDLDDLGLDEDLGLGHVEVRDHVEDELDGVRVALDQQLVVVPGQRLEGLEARELVEAHGLQRGHEHRGRREVRAIEVHDRAVGTLDQPLVVEGERGLGRLLLLGSRLRRGGLRGRGLGGRRLGRRRLGGRGLGGRGLRIVGSHGGRQQGDDQERDGSRNDLHVEHLLGRPSDECRAVL
ncbi:MAG: hypothetical protein P1V36_03200 [Planctomycetota bacterium]|nr:hypothetical protein [Planctomycetota bacterium]